MPGSKPDFEGRVPIVEETPEAEADDKEKSEETEDGAKKPFWKKVNVKSMKNIKVCWHQNRSNRMLLKRWP